MIGPDVRVGDDQTRISLLIFFHNHCIEQPSSWHPCIDYDYCKWRTYLSIWRRLSDMRTCTSNLRGGITWVQRGMFYELGFCPPPLPHTHRQKVAIFSRYYFTQISDSLTNSGPWNNNVAHLICRDGYKRSLRSKWPKTLFGYLRYIVMISRNESYGKCVFFHC